MCVHLGWRVPTGEKALWEYLYSGEKFALESDKPYTIALPDRLKWYLSNGGVEREPDKLYVRDFYETHFTEIMSRFRSRVNDPTGLPCVLFGNSGSGKVCTTRLWCRQHAAWSHLMWMLVWRVARSLGS